MRYRRRRRCGQNTFFFSALVTAAGVVMVLGIAAERAVRPVAKLQAQHFAEKYAATVMERAAADYLDENEFTYSDFASVLYNDGNVVSVETLPYNINKVQSELALVVNQKLSEAGNISDRIPLGSLTGSFLLAGKGPSLKIRICPVGKADVEIKSDMESAGINQTRHRISAVVTSDLASSLPLYSFESEVKYEFLLAENVIIGDVPDLTPIR